MKLKRWFGVLSRQLPVLLWLWALWLLLWGGIRPIPLVGGLLVAVGVVSLFRMPEVNLPVLRRPLGLLGLIGHQLVDLVTSSIVVAWQAVTRGPRVTTGIVEVPLRTESELLIASTAMLSLMVPGSLVMEIDRERRLLYIHALPLSTAESVEHRRKEVARVEDRLRRVFGGDEKGDEA